MLYRLVVGSTKLQDAESGEWVRYSAWENNILDLTPAEAKSLGRRVTPLAETEEGVMVKASTVPRQQKKKATAISDL